MGVVDDDEEGQALSQPQYWDSRYASSDGLHPTHEWFKSFAALRPFFGSHLYRRGPESRILHLGSGDSTIPQDLGNRGYSNQICVDFSSVVVQLMAAKAKAIEWKVADVRNLVDIPDESVDVAFDKGTLDAMIYGSPWDPPDEVKDNTTAYINEVHRVLKDDGVFLYVTFRQPHFIKPLVNYGQMWNLEVEILREDETTFDYHAFIMTKPRESKQPR